VHYFDAGLKNNELCICVASEPLGVDRLREVFRERIAGFDGYLKKGQVEILPYTEWYVKNGRMDLDVVLAGWAEKLRQALDAGYSGLRVSGNTYWLEKGAWNDFLEYEHKINGMLGGRKLSVLCTYSLDKCGAGEILDVTSTHQFALIKHAGKWKRIENVEAMEAKKAQFESETFLSNVFDCIQDGISILDKDLNILRVNPAMEKWYGKDIVGKKCFQAYHGRHEPCEACPSIRALREKTTQKEIVHDLRGWSELYVFPMVDDSGEVTGVIEHVRDIDERKRAEEALKDSEEKYRNLVERINDWLWEIDENCAYTYASPKVSELLGYEPEEILGRTPFDLMPGDEVERVKEIFYPIFAERRQFNLLENMLVKKNGDRIVVETNGMPMFDDRGAFVGYRGVDRDITERKRADSELKSAKDQAELYLDLMSHDINNMNQVSLGFLELALDSLDLDEKGRAIISRSMGAMESSSRLIDKVRKLQKAKSGELSSLEIDLGQILSDVCAYYWSIRAGDAAIYYEPVTGCKVMANELLYDVFSNIVDNATKHTKDMPIVNIRLDEVDECGETFYKVTIEDNGKGVPDELKGQIFDRFRRGNTRAKGKGLGLYLAKTLVESYNGRIWVEDRVPGDHTKGSRFVVLLHALLPTSDKRESDFIVS
jgi:PAS domain S-box-containing protein